MPRVDRKHEHQDFTALQEELRQEKPEAAPVVYGAHNAGRPPKEEDAGTAAGRRRRSLMSDPRMKYAYSKKSKTFHDRDCPNAKDISDEHFQMCREFPANRRPCKECFRKALIRAGLREDFKRIGAYERVFDLLKADNQDLHTLLVEHGAALYGVGSDYVCIRLREDRWMIRARQNVCELHHNNYTLLEGYERAFIKGFHRQQHSGRPTFRNFVRIITEYSWEDHRKALLDRDRAYRIQHLREELAELAIHFREPRFSLLFLYFTFADCDEMAAQHFRACGISPKILIREKHKKTPFSTVLCRVPRWREKGFLTALECLKETIALAERMAYPDYCRKMLK